MIKILTDSGHHDYAYSELHFQLLLKFASEISKQIMVVSGMGIVKTLYVI